MPNETLIGIYDESCITARLVSFPLGNLFSTIARKDHASCGCRIVPSAVVAMNEKTTASPSHIGSWDRG